MIHLSIVIPTRSEPSNLWFTLQAMKFQASDVDFDQLEVIVADNEPEGVTTGRPGAPAKAATAMKMLADCAFPHWQWLDASQKKSPYHPRNVGASGASGEWLLFLDSHVILCKGFVSHLLDQVRFAGLKPENSLTHFPVSFGAERMFGHYTLRLDGDFWGTWNPLPKECAQPYRIGGSGIWAFLVNREFYLDVLEGFNPNFAGYGGGEPYLDLKVWMLGGEVWMDPRVMGAHYSGPRGYGQQWADRIRNFALAISVVAPERMSTFAAAIAEKSKLPPLTIENLIQEGLRAGESEALRFRKRAKYTLPKLQAEWARLGVVA